MSRFAGIVIKKYGDTEKAYQSFLEKAATCVPPLDSSELNTIWHSAQRFYSKISREDGYVGDCLFQKTYSDSRFVRHNNHGEQTQYMVKDHHEAIISREDFEAAHAFIHQRATEKGVVKGSDKYQNRYTFSGKIICGECGDTFKRRIHSCTGYKYTAWCCSTHIKDKDKCHMLFVKDDDLKQASPAITVLRRWCSAGTVASFTGASTGTTTAASPSSGAASVAWSPPPLIRTVPTGR